MIKQFNLSSKNKKVKVHFVPFHSQEQMERGIFQFNFLPENKKGFTLLGKETLGILVALLCILFLVLFAVAIYSTVTTSNGKKQAEGTLNGENGIIAQIKTGESISSFGISSPGGWYLFGFTSTKPNSCLGENCLCICKKVNWLESFDKTAQGKECDEKGVCGVVSNLKEDFKIEIKKGEITTLSILQINDEVSITQN